MDATIVIPTKNAGSSFKKVLDSVFDQITTAQYEVICVDSGSTDGTVELIKQYPAVVHEIPSEQFGHGRTRNLGASLGTGQYIIFITQDALPASQTWLQGFIDAMNTDEEIAGAFGIHYPYPNCNLLDSRDITGLFESYGSTNQVIEITDLDRYNNDQDYVRWLSFFSDNNACIRRSDWEQHPYPDVNFAEDQLWIRERLSEGKKKIYTPNAPVYHSHNYGFKDLAGRYYDEYQALYTLFPGFTIAPRWLHVPKAAQSAVKADWAYVGSLQTLTVRERLKWKLYAFLRDWIKFIFAMLGARSNRLRPAMKEKLDRIFSQQHSQRTA